MHSILKNCFLFQTLNNTQIEELASICTIETFNKDNILFFEGDKPKYLHILLTGNVEVYKTDKVGNKTIIHHFKGESMIAEMANFYNLPFPATASFTNDGKVLKIKLLENFIFQNVMLDATGRVARFLLDNEYTSYKKNEIANILNITPVSLSRILTNLNNKNIIKNNKKEINVLDRKSLQSLCLI